MLSYFRNYFTKVKLWNRTVSRAEKLRDELSELFSDVEIVVATGTPAECINDADCIVTATNTSSPLFHLKDLKENVHINGEFYFPFIFCNYFSPAMSIIIAVCVLLLSRN